MQHLEAERLAALDEVEPTLDELSHLAACAHCRAEREAYAALRQMAYDTGRHVPAADAPRLTSWEALSSSLRHEGLLTSTVDITPLKTPVVVKFLQPQPLAGEPTDSPVAAEPTVTAMRRGMPSWARAAAAVALMAASAYAGRVSAGFAPAGTAADTNSASPSAGVTVQQVLGGREMYASVDDATAALSRAQNEYERASLWLASNDTTTRSSDVYRARLAALDQMMAASKAALRDAPQDPVLNHYFLAAYTAREATLQQLGGALPVDKTIETY